MRTRAELEIEARQLEKRAREAPGHIETPFTIAALAPPPLFTFPESSVKLYAAPNSDVLFTARMIRCIDVTEGRAGFEYKLMEEEFISDSQGKLVRHYDPIGLITSDNALEVLSVGYQRLDEDRLWERVDPVRSRIETNGFTLAEHAEAVAEVQRYALEMELSASALMRVKTDTIDLLEGRLEMGDFVSRTVARQECFAPVQRTVLSRQITESIEI